MRLQATAVVVTTDWLVFVEGETSHSSALQLLAALP